MCRSQNFFNQPNLCSLVLSTLYVLILFLLFYKYFTSRSNELIITLLSTKEGITMISIVQYEQLQRISANVTQPLITSTINAYFTISSKKFAMQAVHGNVSLNWQQNSKCFTMTCNKHHTYLFTICTCNTECRREGVWVCWCVRVVE